MGKKKKKKEKFEFKWKNMCFCDGKFVFTR